MKYLVALIFINLFLGACSNDKILNIAASEPGETPQQLKVKVNNTTEYFADSVRVNIPNSSIDIIENGNTTPISFTGNSTIGIYKPSVSGYIMTLSTNTTPIDSVSIDIARNILNKWTNVGFTSASFSNYSTQFVLRSRAN